MNETMIITKVQRLENENNKQWREYPIGVEGAYTYIRNGNGGAKTAQSLLMKELEPQTYIYGQPIWDANNQVLESLTWENIQKWLNQGRINDFLKEGDCIEVTTDINISSVPNVDEYMKYHFYIIGINRHNGQSINDLGLDHIDFCGGSMAQLSKKFVEDNEISRTQYNFAYMPSNNGGVENTVTNDIIENTVTNHVYGNYFVDGVFSINSNIVKTPVQCLEEICQNEIPISEKVLFLDARYLPIMDFMNFWVGNSDDVIVNDVSALLIYLAQLYEDIKENGGEENLVNVYTTLINGLQNMNNNIPLCHPIDSDLATKVLRISVGIGKDDFLEKTGQNNSDFALELLRLSLVLSTIDLETPEGIQILSDLISGVAQGARGLNGILEICKTAYNWLTNDMYYNTTSKKSVLYPAINIWGLTEKEFFGECTFSKAEYAQGQIFQYPIFNNLSFRKKITRDLSRSIGGICNMVTLTPVENSNTKVAGMDPETLMPIEASILKTNTYIPDMPICFRIQEERPIALQNQGGE